MPTRHIARRILVPLDGSGLATVTIPHLRALATVETEILLLRVVPGPLPVIEIAGGETVPYDEIRKRNLNTCSDYLQTIARELSDVSPHITKLARISTPADEIVRVAEERDIDLVLMATHGRGAVGRLVIGSVANRVAQASTVPVMLIQAQHGRLPQSADHVADYQRIIVPLDGSDRARTALPVAAELARNQNVPIHLVRVIPSEDTMTASLEELNAETAELRTAGIDAGAELLVGATVPSILESIGDGDIVVMTSHGEGGLRHWLMGGVAEKIVTMAESPVVLVPVEERRKLTRLDSKRSTA